MRRHRTHFDVTEMMNCVARTVPSILFLKMEAIHVSSQRPQISHNRSTLLRHYITEQLCVLSLHTIRYIPYLISSLLLYRTDIKIFFTKENFPLRIMEIKWGHHLLPSNHDFMDW